MSISGNDELKAVKVESPLLAGLIHSEVIDWVNKLKKSLENLERMQSEGSMGSTLTAQSAISVANQLAGTLLNNMEMLAGLAETYAGQNEDSRERFFLFTLVNDVVKSKPGVPQFRFVLKEPDRQVAPVYGNKRWLELMLAHLLHELDRSIHPVDQRIVITLRQLGNHMIMRAQSEAMPHIERKRDRPKVMWVEGLTLSLCRRIAELHGGTLSLDAEDDVGSDELTGFVLSLPTSSPQTQDPLRCSDCSLIKQIENYAVDLAELIDRCRELEQTRSTDDGQVVNR
ncbi:MAG: hypothetical protein WCK63_06680 [Betaproteobacteria bacterium]